MQTFRRSSWGVSSLSALILCFALGGPNAKAQEDAPPPPRMPPGLTAKFDREAVTQLVQEIEKGANASTLTYAYFTVRLPHALPVSDGLELVKAALAKEKIGSKRWFLLQSLAGYAAFRVQGVPDEEGFVAYNLVFDRVAEAPKVGAQFSVAQSIRQYVFSVGGRFIDLGLSNDPRTKSTLLKAWSTYLELSRQKFKFPQEPSWSRAIEVASAYNEFLPLLKSALTSPTGPKNAAVLLAAAQILRSTEPKLAVTTLQQAIEKMPKTGPTSDTVAISGLTTLLVEWLQADGRGKEAVPLLQKRIEQGNGGQAKLALLFYELKDEQGFNQASGDLMAATANEGDITWLALKLLSLYRQAPVLNESAGRKASELLTNYLTIQRTRNVAFELQARLSLVSWYVAQKQKAEALKVLTVDAPTPTNDPNQDREARSYYVQLQQWGKTLKSTP